MGFFKRLLGLEDKKETIEGYIVVVETPKKTTLRKVSHALLGNKLDDKDKIKQKLSRRDVALVITSKKKSRSKKKRMSNIEKSLAKVKKSAKKKREILLVGNHVQDALKKKLRREFPHKPIHDIKNTRSYKKFKERLKVTIPFYFVKNTV